VKGCQRNWRSQAVSWAVLGGAAIAASVCAGYEGADSDEPFAEAGGDARVTGVVSIAV
jgi:hypothetical protein